jgi:hypothetical protein
MKKYGWKIKGWSCDSSGRTPDDQTQGPEFKPQHHKKERERKRQRQRKREREKERKREMEGRKDEKE